MKTNSGSFLSLGMGGLGHGSRVASKAFRLFLNHFLNRRSLPNSMVRNLLRIQLVGKGYFDSLGRVRCFDITRLIRRSGSGTPTGMDRVDLAYGRWLRSKGPVVYLAHGIDRFEVLDSERGDAFLDHLHRFWAGGDSIRAAGAAELATPQASLKHRALSWWKRRKAADALSGQHDMEWLCEHKLEELDAMDPSSGVSKYGRDSSWDRLDAEGLFFGLSHNLLGRTDYLRALASKPELKRVFFIHDAIPCDHPDLTRRGEGARHLLRIRNAHRYGTHLIVNSLHTRERLEYWREKMSLEALPTEVLPIGLDERITQAPSQPAPDSGAYFVVLGTIDARKNHGLLVEAWTRLAESTPPDQMPTLKIIGKPGWGHEALHEALAQASSARPFIECLSDVSDEALWPILRGARALLFPSLVEGWGMPVVEAMAMGVPVIASDIPAFRESGQGLAQLLPTDDPQAWAQTVTDYVDANSPTRKQQIDQMQSFSAPSWDEHFAKLEHFIELEA